MGGHKAVWYTWPQAIAVVQLFDWVVQGDERLRKFPDQTEPSAAPAALSAMSSMVGSHQKHCWGPRPWSEGKVAQSCLNLYDPLDCSQPGSSLHGIFPTQGSNLGLQHCRQSLPSEPPGKADQVGIKNAHTPPMWDMLSFRGWSGPVLRSPVPGCEGRGEMNESTKLGLRG